MTMNLMRTKTRKLMDFASMRAKIRVVIRIKLLRDVLTK